VTTRRLVALLALAVAACTSQPSLGSRFDGPTAVVAFRGFSRKDVAIRDYVAVASSRGDELRLLDPADLQPVLSPGAVFPLSIPTAPRPLLLASAALGDLDANGNPLADVLVAASAGGATSDSAGPALQLIETWDATNRVAQTVPLTGLAAGSEILCLVGMPARAASATLPAANARILVGASGVGGIDGQLAIVEFTRAQDGSGAVVSGTATVKALGFAPADIAVGPEGATIFVATRDPITTTDPTFGQVFGVARIDASGDIVSGPVTALAAGPKDPDNLQIGAGTIAVAAASNVPERTVNSSVVSSPETFTPTATPVLVYAALDPSSCGKGKPIDCGIVTIDPAKTLTADAASAGSLVADPAAADPAFLIPDSGPSAVAVADRAQKYRAPMPVPGVPLHIAIGVPPASGTQRFTTDSLNPGIPLLSMAPGTGERKSGAVAMVASSDGNVYWLDLSRWGPPSDVSVTRGAQPPSSTRVGVTSVTPAALNGSYQLGLWLDVAPFGTDPFTPAVQADASGIASAIDVWPGFTDADTWTLAYQGPLPSLSARPGLLGTSSTGTYAAIQTRTGVIATSIADPSLGVRIGDIVEVSGVCEATVAAVLPASDPASAAELDALAAATGVSFKEGEDRGGAVRLNPPDPLGVTCRVDQLPAPGPPSDATITVRSSGMVLSNLKLGYLGRPVLSRPSDDPAATTFSVSWSSALDGPTAPATRDAQEAQAVARKARRRFYPSDPPCPIAAAGTEGGLASGCYGSGMKRLTDPLAPGPIIRFRVGLSPSDAVGLPVRGDSIVLVTQAGLSQTFRKPSTGGAGAGGAIAFDRTALDPAGKAKAQFAGQENDPILFFEPYLDDQVLVFSPSQSAVTSVR
jgi:hypothetical protein